jgi:hypothetical protein
MANDLVMANDLDDLDGAEDGPQLPKGRELVIVDLRHGTIMPPSWAEGPGRIDAAVAAVMAVYRAAELADSTPAIYA